MVVVGVGALEQALAGRFGAPEVFGQLGHWPEFRPVASPGSDCLLGLCDCRKHLKRSCDRHILEKEEVILWPILVNIDTFDGYVSHDLMCPGASDCRIALMDTR